MILILAYFYKVTRHGLHILQLENYYLDRYAVWMKRYLNKVLKRFDDTERKERKREKQKAKRDEKKAKQEVCDTIFEEIKENINSSEKSIPDYIRAIISDINDGNTYPELDTEQKKYLLNKLSALLENEEKIKLDKDKKIKRILEQANLLVDEKAKTTELKLKYWKFLKDDINSEDGQIRIPKSVKKEVEDLIDLKVNEISDLLYYEQVKYFTRDFSFLREYSEIVQANKGHSDRKFTDFESYKRFHNLSGQLQKGNDEYKQIQFMLKTDNIDKMDRAILNERIKVLEREHADQTIR